MPAACLGYIDIVLNLCTANADVNVEDKVGLLWYSNLLYDTSIVFSLEKRLLHMRL